MKMLYTRFYTMNNGVFQEAQLRDQEREVALKEAEEESRLQEQVPVSMRVIIERLHHGINVGEKGLTFYIRQVEEAKRRSEQEAREAEEKEKARQVGDKRH